MKCSDHPAGSLCVNPPGSHYAHTHNFRTKGPTCTMENQYSNNTPLLMFLDILFVLNINNKETVEKNRLQFLR